MPLSDTWPRWMRGRRRSSSCASSPGYRWKRRRKTWASPRRPSSATGPWRAPGSAGPSKAATAHEPPNPEAPDWPSVKEIFAEASHLPGDARAAYVHQAAAGDQAVEREVLRLLRLDEGAEEWLAGLRPPTEVVRSGERRVGEEGKFRWAPDHLKKKKRKKIKCRGSMADKRRRGGVCSTARAAGNTDILHGSVLCPAVGWGLFLFFFFSSRRRHTRCLSDWSSDVCSSDLALDIASTSNESSFVNRTLVV